MSEEKPLPDRSCGKCNLCCKLLIIPELGKDDNVWCEHCDIGNGCTIYAERPQMCRAFFCRYMRDPSLDERWNPARARFLLRNQDDRTLIVQVDPQRPDAWSREPYHSALRTHASKAYARRGMIFVKIGSHALLMLPDREVDLGVDQDSQRVTVTPEFTPNGVRWNVTTPIRGN